MFASPGRHHPRLPRGAVESLAGCSHCPHPGRHSSTAPKWTPIFIPKALTSVSPPTPSPPLPYPLPLTPYPLTIHWPRKKQTSHAAENLALFMKM